MLWRLGAAIHLLWFIILAGGCTVTLPYEDRAIKVDLLEKAGFHPLDTSTPHGQELLAATPKGQFIAYNLGGSIYYVYADHSGFSLYFGNEAAYQKYRSMVKDQRLCQSLDAEDWGPFWSCFEEYQKSGGGK